VPHSWHAMGTGDFDGNGRADILWRNDNGALSIWDDGTIEGGHNVVGPAAVPGTWDILA
jgi:FG-GAP repeat